MAEIPTLPPHEADINERIAGFNAALQPLLGKYELGLTANVQITTDGRLQGVPLLISMRKAPVAEAPVNPEAPVAPKQELTEG